MSSAQTSDDLPVSNFTDIFANVSYNTSKGPTETGGPQDGECRITITDPLTHMHITNKVQKGTYRAFADARGAFLVKGTQVDPGDSLTRHTHTTTNGRTYPGIDSLTGTAPFEVEVWDKPPPPGKYRYRKRALRAGTLTTHPLTGEQSVVNKGIFIQVEDATDATGPVGEEPDDGDEEDEGQWVETEE